MNNEDIKNSIIQMRKVLEEFNKTTHICYGTKENIEKIKMCLPKNIEARIVPDSYFPDEMRDKIYIIPVEYLEVGYAFD